MVRTRGLAETEDDENAMKAAAMRKRVTTHSSTTLHTHAHSKHHSPPPPPPPLPPNHQHITITTTTNKDNKLQTKSHPPSSLLTNGKMGVSGSQRPPQPQQPTKQHPWSAVSDHRRQQQQQLQQHQQQLEKYRNEPTTLASAVKVKAISISNPWMPAKSDLASSSSSSSAATSWTEEVEDDDDEDINNNHNYHNNYTNNLHHGGDVYYEEYEEEVVEEEVVEEEKEEEEEEEEVYDINAQDNDTLTITTIDTMSLRGDESFSTSFQGFNEDISSLLGDLSSFRAPPPPLPLQSYHTPTIASMLMHSALATSVPFPQQISIQQSQQQEQQHPYPRHQQQQQQQQQWRSSSTLTKATPPQPPPPPQVIRKTVNPYSSYYASPPTQSQHPLQSSPLLRVSHSSSSSSSDQSYPSSPTPRSPPQTLKPRPRPPPLSRLPLPPPPPPLSRLSVPIPQAEGKTYDEILTSASSEPLKKNIIEREGRKGEGGGIGLTSKESVIEEEVLDDDTDDDDYDDNDDDLSPGAYSHSHPPMIRSKMASTATTASTASTTVTTTTTSAKTVEIVDVGDHSYSHSHESVSTDESMNSYIWTIRAFEHAKSGQLQFFIQPPPRSSRSSSNVVVANAHSIVNHPPQSGDNGDNNNNPSKITSDGNNANQILSVEEIATFIRHLQGRGNNVASTSRHPSGGVNRHRRHCSEPTLSSSGAGATAKSNINTLPMIPEVQIRFIVDDDDPDEQSSKKPSALRSHPVIQFIQSLFEDEIKAVAGAADTDTLAGTEVSDHSAEPHSHAAAAAAIAKKESGSRGDESQHSSTKDAIQTRTTTTKATTKQPGFWNRLMGNMKRRATPDLVTKTFAFVALDDDDAFNETTFTPSYYCPEDDYMHTDGNSIAATADSHFDDRPVIPLPYPPSSELSMERELILEKEMVLEKEMDKDKDKEIEWVPPTPICVDDVSWQVTARHDANGHVLFELRNNHVVLTTSSAAEAFAMVGKDVHSVELKQVQEEREPQHPGAGGKSASANAHRSSLVIEQRASSVSKAEIEAPRRGAEPLYIQRCSGILNEDSAEWL